MALFESTTEIKKVIFNGIEIQSIFNNAVECFKKVLEIFKNGVLNEACQITNSEYFEIIDSQIVGAAYSAKTADERSTAFCIFKMDVTDYSQIIINGNIELYAGTNGSAAIAYRIDSDAFVTVWSIDTGRENTGASFGIDVSEYTGEQYFSIYCYTSFGTDKEEKYAKIYIDKMIALE